MPIYKAVVEEHNGEKEYTDVIFIVADDLKAAEKWAERFVEDWYEDGEGPDEYGWYEAEGGAIVWRLDYVSEEDHITAYNAKGGYTELKLAEVENETT